MQRLSSMSFQEELLLISKMVANQNAVIYSENELDTFTHFIKDHCRSCAEKMLKSTRFLCNQFAVGRNGVSVLPSTYHPQIMNIFANLKLNISFDDIDGVYLVVW